MSITLFTRGEERRPDRHPGRAACREALEEAAYLVLRRLGLKGYLVAVLHAVFRVLDDSEPPYTVRIKAPDGMIILERVLRDLPTGRPQSAPPVQFKIDLQGDVVAKGPKAAVGVIPADRRPPAAAARR